MVIYLTYSSFMFLNWRAGKKRPRSKVTIIGFYCVYSQVLTTLVVTSKLIESEIIPLASSTLQVFGMNSVRG
jgi:hypothetical protein